MANYFDNMFAEFKDSEIVVVNEMDETMGEFIERTGINQNDFRNFILSTNSLVQIVGIYHNCEVENKTSAIMHVLLRLYRPNIRWPYDFLTQINIIKEDIGEDNYNLIHPLLYKYIEDIIDIIIEEN